jgi:ankyrin repeat protein
MSFTGTWRCNTDRWELPFPKPRSWTVRIRVDGWLISVVETVDQADGARFVIALRAGFDGKSYPVHGSPTMDTVAYTRAGDALIEVTGHKDGIISFTGALTVSPDGTALTLAGTIHGSAPLNVTAVFDRLPPDPHAELVDSFLLNAALDWRTGGLDRGRKTHAAARLLARHPEIARENIYTAVVCGDLDTVERILADRSAAASEPGGPHAWPPLLYLCNARHAENSLAIARALLDRGADPNVYYPGGNPSIHYTALTAVLGRGEEQAEMHPHAREIVALLLDRGADPYDTQVLYNMFAGHASQRHLGGEAMWLLDLIRTHSLARGREPDWDTPKLLAAAIQIHHVPLAEWLLAHGANPNAPSKKGTAYELAIIRGLTDITALLERHGASTSTNLTSEDAFTAACLRLDRAEVQTQLAAHPEYLQLPKPMTIAAETNRADVIHFLVDLGMSPDVEDLRRGRARPLHDAAYYDSPDAARALLDRGAAIDFHDEIHDATALWWAVWGQKPRMVEMLSPLSCDVWSLTVAGKSDRIREVLDADPRRAKATYQGETPLFWLPDDELAALAIIDAFLTHGADPTLKNADGETATDRARTRGLDTAAARLS